MKRFLICNKCAVIMLVIFIIIFPIIVLLSLEYGFIPRDIGMAIVGYGGAIIGGFLTLYGVWWTINDNNEKRKKDLELQYCPVLMADIIENTEVKYRLCSEITILYNHGWFDDSNLEYLNSVIKLSNVGRGEISGISIKIEDCNVLSATPYELIKNIDLQNSYILCDGLFEFVPINGNFYLYVGVPNLRKEYRGAKEKYVRIDMILNIFVSGVFTTDDQEYKLHFYIDTYYRNDDVVHDVNTMTFMKVK